VRATAETGTLHHEAIVNERSARSEHLHVFAGVQLFMPQQFNGFLKKPVD